MVEVSWGELRTEVLSGGVVWPSSSRVNPGTWGRHQIRNHWARLAGGQPPSYLPPLPILIRANSSQTRRSGDCGSEWRYWLRDWEKPIDRTTQSRPEMLTSVVQLPVMTSCLWPPSSPLLTIFLSSPVFLTPRRGQRWRLPTISSGFIAAVVSQSLLAVLQLIPGYPRVNISRDSQPGTAVNLLWQMTREMTGC